MACCLDELDALNEPLLDEEKPGIERMAPVRLREYVAGRTAARRAVSILTGATAPLPRNADRSPSWPAGLCGSISHSRRLAICVVAKLADFEAIGVDIEEDMRLDEDLWPLVMTGTELALLERLGAGRARQTGTLLFSAKEAYCKCLHRSVQEPGRLPEPNRIETAPDFDAATVTCYVARDESFPRAQGRFVLFGEHWITLFALPAAGPISCRS